MLLETQEFKSKSSCLLQLTMCLVIRITVHAAYAPVDCWLTPWLFLPKTRPYPKILKPQPQINNLKLQKRIRLGWITRLPCWPFIYGAWQITAVDLWHTAVRVGSHPILSAQWHTQAHSILTFSIQPDRFQKTSITFVLFNVELSNLAPMGTNPAHQFSAKSPKSVSSYPVVRCIFCFVCIFFCGFLTWWQNTHMLIIPKSPCLDT